jgi:hypothetical protein
METAVERVIDD